MAGSAEVVGFPIMHIHENAQMGPWAPDVKFKELGIPYLIR